MVWYAFVGLICLLMAWFQDATDPQDAVAMWGWLVMASVAGATASLHAAIDRLSRKLDRR